MAEQRPVFGWVEKVLVTPGDLPIHAKLDTGADFSSLSAENVEEFDKDGVPWVRFSIKNRYGKKTKFEKEIKRMAVIKRHNGKNQRRAVIRLGICLGHSYMEEDVNIVDRSRFEYQMLIGRSYLAGLATIDPAVTYTTEPNCIVKSAP